MEPIINLQETLGKVVGRRKLRPQQSLSLHGATKADMRAWQKAFPMPSIPKGVYRFKSHEEADAWTWKMITRPRD
ncbi:hypothetical protein ACXR0O_20720 [Verrucomicrobiota bacterium sgz303538]